MQNTIPINISVISACLKKAGHEVDLFDTTFYRLQDETVDDKRAELGHFKHTDMSHFYKDTDMDKDFLTKIYDYKPDLVAFTIVEDTFPLAKRLCDMTIDGGTATVVGGVFPTVAPWMCRDVADYMCTGEGEKSIVEYCNNPSDEIKKGPLVDLDSLPMYDYGLFEENRFYRPFDGKLYKTVPIETDRGCPYGCTYCSAPTLKKIMGVGYYRSKSISKIIDEVNYYTGEYKPERMYFTAESFLAKPVEWLEELKEEYFMRCGLPFLCQTHVTTVTEYKARLLSDMGCDRVAIGIEHGNEKFRAEKLGKQFTNEQAIEACKILEDNGIQVTVNNMVGFPDETEDLMWDTIKLNKKLKCTTRNCYMFVPYRGAPLREEALEKGYIKDDVETKAIMTSVLNHPTDPNWNAKVQYISVYFQELCET